MATLANEKNGRRKIIFTGLDDRPKKISLGKIPKERAQAIKRKIEDLVHCQATGYSPKTETTNWLSELSGPIAERLAVLGLTTRRESSTLSDFVDAYIAKRGDVADSTAANYRHTRRNLVDCFGEDRTLRDINAADAEDFRRTLLADGLADSTTRKRSAIASQIFRYARKCKIIDINPFDDVPKNVQGSDRQAYVLEADAAKVLEQLPNNEWKLLFALSRWAGLRVGSEVRRLRWQDIDWAKNRFLVHIPKTEHIKGRETRLTPLFPEVATLLAERLELAEDGAELVLPMLVGRTDASLRATVQRAAKAAGVRQWTRLWHSMRSSCQTDLEQRFPTHVVCSWLGNNEATARKHYLQTTDADFDRAAEPSRVQNRVHPTREHGSTALHSPLVKSKNLGKHCNSSISRGTSIVREGLEPPTKGL